MDKRNGRNVIKFIIGTILLHLQRPTFGLSCPQKCKCSWVLDSLEADCSNSGLEECPSFNTLPVEHLDLSGNKFQKFPSHLASIQSLIYLDLSDNQIEFLDEDALFGFTTLRTLILANNTFTKWHNLNPSKTFRIAMNLQTLSLSGNSLQSFTDQENVLLITSQTISELDLSNCDIKIATGQHTLSRMPRLERLTLSGNPLGSMSSLPSHSIRHLDVSNCSLKRIETYFLDGLPRLETINLSSNAGIIIGSKTSDVLECHSLHEIDVSFCSLDLINFEGFPSLSIARLRGNMLRRITEKTFANNPEIEIIDLARNSIHHLDDNAFSVLRRLTRLDLSYNEIFRIQYNLFRNNDALVVLNLSRNFINKFTKFFSNSLRDINLSWCEILSVDANVFSELASILKLDLSNNLIKDFPSGMSSETLQKLDLNNCRLTTIKNRTFQGFPELASLWLSGNRFTNSFPIETFRSNTYLDEIWLGDNPWRCDCDNSVFLECYNFLTTTPMKLKDKFSLRCASPAEYYSKTWEAACLNVWYPKSRGTNAEKVWTSVLVMLLTLIAILFLFSCIRNFIEERTKYRNRREFQENHDELMEIRRQNRLILEQDAHPNAPIAQETNLPSYEDAILMPKIDRPTKSMTDLSSTLRKNVMHIYSVSITDDGLVLDRHHRFRSEDMLSVRAKERTENIGNIRRGGQVARYGGNRQHKSIDNRFASAHLKSQNLQSAERLSILQSYENSPYPNRKLKPLEIPPYRRLIYERESFEFYTDSECNSKPGSPFAKRLPKQLILSDYSLRNSQTTHQHDNDGLNPAVEDYFGERLTKSRSKSGSSSSSDFQIVPNTIEADISSLPDHQSLSSDIDWGNTEDITVQVTITPNHKSICESTI